jgi:anti-anti-sigma factor
MLLEIEHHEVGPQTVVIRLAGKLMLGPEGEQVTTLVQDLIGKAYRRFIFDIAELKRIDSTGIGRFISSLNAIQAVGGRMAIAAATDHLRECFRATRLDTIFALFPDTGAATKGVAS